MNFEEALVYELETISGLVNKVFPQTAKEGPNHLSLFIVLVKAKKFKPLKATLESKNCS
jgi:hypothetical protein